ncbi:hypothetical protein DH2020_022008 [Rehmannia glutinosa]|uniref:MLO-like protein n=1 Tax=Rehmannia glutinosa TaxID=99300 RepID=A0ABR0WEB3_REHGL
MSGGGEEEGTTLEFTPTWVVAGVCTVIVALSLAAERLLHYAGKYLKKKNQKPLYEALQKVKEELMLLGFISLLLTVFQGRIVKLCVPPGTMKHLLPCSLSSEAAGGEESNASPEASGHHRRLLAEEAGAGFCAAKNKVPLLSLEALHHLHIFIFVLAIVHVTFSVLTIVFGGAKIRQWKHWEDSIAKDNYNSEHALKHKVTHVHQHDFIKKRFSGMGKHSVILGWLHSFFKQFYGSVTKSDYTALRLGFIMLLYDSLVLLLAVGTKLEHVISQLANEVAEKHSAIEGELVVQPSDDHFWFHRPYIILFLIHFILFQNAFEIAFFFWIWVQYGFDSCIMGQVKYIVPRLIIGYSAATVHYRCMLSSHSRPCGVGTEGQEEQRVKISAWWRLYSRGFDRGGSSLGIQLTGIGRKEANPPPSDVQTTNGS